MANRKTHHREYERRICRAIDFINANLVENPSIADIAEAALFSPFHFQRLFRAIVGETVAQFTRRVRLETGARRLVFHPTDDVTSIAFDLGFSSSQNFAKAFKKQFGCSPSDYRERSHAGLENDEQQPETLQFGGGAGLDEAVRVVEQPALTVAYRRHFGSYDDAGVQAAFEKLVQWAKARNLDAPTEYIGIPWDDADVTDEERCRFDAGLIVATDIRIDGDANVQTIAAGRYAVFNTEVVGNDFDMPWTLLMRGWLPGSGYEPASGARYERYLSDGSDDPDGRWQVELHLPIQRI